MTSFASTYTLILSMLTFIADIGIIFIILCFFVPQFKKQFLPFIKKYAIELAFIVSFGATVGSFFYSEIIGFEPCKLCWFQRILMYPQPLILGIALAKKHTNVRDYILPFAILGMIIAGIHYYTQIGGTSTLCPESDTAISCIQRFIFEFNYITIPVMSFTVFALVSLLMVSQKIKLK